HRVCCASFLFFHGPLPIQPLHSFPTRRSSDLVRSAVPTARHQMDCHGCPDSRARNLGEAVGESTSLAFQFSRRRRGASGKLKCRSEEHTSELQSLRHLVCRLLLEKKNINGVRT